jgi:mRNA-degrading endonuclease toxin of MazEF toxin-antitoxin module
MCFATVLGVMKSRFAISSCSSPSARSPSTSCSWGQARRHRPGDRRRLSHEPPDAREEVIQRDRLRQVVVGAEQEAGHPVRLIGPRGRNEDDGQVLAVPLPELAADLVARRPGQVRLHDHERGPLPTRCLQGLLARACLLRQIASAPQGPRECGARPGISVNHQHWAGPVHRGPRYVLAPPGPSEATLGDVRSREQAIRRAGFAVATRLFHQRGARPSVVIRPLLGHRRGGSLAWVRSMSEVRIRREGLPGGTPARDFGLRADSVSWAGSRRSVKARLLRPRAIAVAAPLGSYRSVGCPVRRRWYAARDPPGVRPQGLTERSSCARAFTALFSTEGKVKLCGGI